jgi:hypothetical protein
MKMLPKIGEDSMKPSSDGIGVDVEVPHRGEP